MFNANTWCFDLEIVNAIPEKKEPGLPGINYCKGWGDHAGMGVSVLVASRVDGTDVQVFMQEDLPKFQVLVNNSDIMIGHNSRAFDAKVLLAFGVGIPEKIHLDFYHEIKLATRNHFPRGFGLAVLSPRCGGPKKTEDGALAPIMWQRGERERVIDYCKNDILMTCAVAQYYAKRGACLPGPDNVDIRLRQPSAIALGG